MADEREQGVCFIDIGYDTTSVCVYKENKLLFTKCITDGANNITKAISEEFGLSMLEAEQLKKKHGTANSSTLNTKLVFNLKRRDKNQPDVVINLYKLASIIESRYIGIYNQIFTMLQEVDLVDYIASGVVLAGGGSKMKGLVKLSKRYLNMPVVMTSQHPAISVAEPFDSRDGDKITSAISSMIEDPEFYTAFGTLIYSQSDQFRHSERSFEEAIIHSQKRTMMKRLHNFLKDTF